MAVPEGSFWKAFVHPQSPIDEILEKENFKLEELLEHDEIIQECKYLNSGLIEYLSRPETVEKLIRYVIQPAPAISSLDEESKQEPQPARYPYVSSELFACEAISMLDTLFEHPHLLALFFTFLSQKPPLDPSSAGYFRKVVVILIQRKFEQLVKFIQANNILDAMVNHIGLYSIMELLIMVGWDDSLGQVNDSKWLYEQNLVPKLVAKLDPTYEKEEDVQVNAARALVDVVVKCAPTSDSLLIRHLQHPSVLNKLFRYMFSGSRGSLTNSLSIVIVLVQREANRRNEIQPSGDQASGTTDSKDSMTGLPEIIAQVLKHLPELSALLKENQDLRKALPTQFGSLSPPLGETRMKAVELFLVLFRSNYPEVNKELAALNVISFIIDLFFKFEWNNMLHGLVESIIRTILDTDSLILKQSCFVAGRLVDRVLEAYAKNAEAVKAQKGCRLGYMGHVVRLCGAIAYVLDRDVKLKQQLLGEQIKEWDAFVAGPLHQDNESHNAVLAGGAPAFPPEPEEQPQSQYTPASFPSETGPRVPPTKDDDDDNDPFAFNDGEDTFSSSNTYGLPREEEEWNHDNSATSQFQTDWPDLYHTRDSTGVEEHSDSSDEEAQPNFAPADTGGGSSDEDDDDGFHRTKAGKKKKSRNPGSSPGGPSGGDSGTKEDGKESSPVKSTGTESAASSPSTTSSSTTSTSTSAPTRNGTGDEWAAFED